MARLERLAPGDVATAVRQYELWDETPDVRAFYRRVAAEVAAKESRYESLSPARVDRGPTAPLYG